MDQTYKTADSGKTPIGTIAFSLMYYNLRVRKEAFDIQHLVASLGTNPAPTASPIA